MCIRDSGRPALYSTTKEFLDDLNLKRLSDLPELPDPVDNIVQDEDHQTIPQAV